MLQKQKSVPKHKSSTLAGAVLAVILAVLVVMPLVVLGGPVVYQHAFVSMPDLPEPPLKDLAATQGVRLGMLTYPYQLTNATNMQVLTGQYSMVTGDGQIHWDKFRPSPTEYDFEDMDKMVAYAGRHNMAVQGHHLVWDEADSLPKWLKDGVQQGIYAKSELLDIIHAHISLVVGRYKGKIAEWSVVNEAFTRTQHQFGLQAWWAGHTGGGTEYIDNAFIWARQADPDARLILNDFYNETKNPVSDAMFEYLKLAKAHGIPVDGIGMQMHIDAAWPPDRADMTANMRRFGELGYPVYITEFDINSSAVKGGADYKSQLESKIATDVVKACIESHSCVSFTVFGMKDKVGLERWMSRGGRRSYLLTGRYQPKVLFQAFHDAWQ